MPAPLVNGHVHVPAWKKLGLKLKFAKDSADVSPATEISIQNNRKRTFDEDPDAAGASPKRKRGANLGAVPESSITSSNPAASNNARGGSTSSFPSILTNGNESGAAVNRGRPTSSKSRKSVTFTQETKTEDGDSTKDLLRNWEEEYDKPSPAPLRANQQRLPQDLQKDLMDAPSSQPNVLIYLDQYLNNRPAWKFNKSREIHVLNHILSIDHMPTSYNIHLLEYLRGLKGQGARSRLRKAAEDAIAADEEVAAEQGKGDASLQAQYDESVEMFKWSLEYDDPEQHVHKERHGNETRKRLEKRNRAELVLWAVNEAEAEPSARSETLRRETSAEPSPSGGILTNGAVLMNRARVKKRKQRTNLINISESSSSSSSESSENESKSDSETDSGSSSSMNKSSSSARDGSDTSSGNVTTEADEESDSNSSDLS